jgi:hypothetical protein
LLDNFKVFKAEDVTPPEGRTTVQWMDSWKK